MAAGEEILKILPRIENKIDTLIALMSRAAPASPSVADDADLDSEWGNPQIRFDPKRWQGESMAGRRMSECTAEYLDELASFLTWRAGKEDEEGKTDSKGKPKSYWSRKDAARAAGWAKRLRSRVPADTASPAPATAAADDSFIPF